MAPEDRQSVGQQGIMPTEVLTEAQLACLRLVHKGPSKVIAKELGISHHTVDDHLREAIRRLGVTKRHEAAALLSHWEQAYPQGLRAQSPAVANSPEPAMIGVSPAMAGAEMPAQENLAKEERAEFGAPAIGSMGFGKVTQYWFGSLFAELTGKDRLRGTLILALIVSVIVLVLVGVGNAVQSSVQAYFGR
ncbi:helix-turn-helix transcriptional regulator [Sphingomonas canadensis]|uniref:Helix-turn-helix transcriptional regulator n=1 Tax=Sphingomonas canadensis TaxID=1219257 RepID=A0ABW3H9D0_9SPHN|nr:helix-turn-helix transcriptional regulator [Sphingomonas canadensis]MCW3837739.1 helix-turn-helix transcriptional regulator [Sphingomonas canadensis]